MRNRSRGALVPAPPKIASEPGSFCSGAIWSRNSAPRFFQERRTARRPGRPCCRPLGGHRVKGDDAVIGRWRSRSGRGPWIPGLHAAVAAVGKSSSGEPITWIVLFGFAKGHDPARGPVRADGNGGVASLVLAWRKISSIVPPHLAALDMGRTDIVRRRTRAQASASIRSPWITHQGRGDCPSATKSGKPVVTVLGQHRILRIAGPLVDEFMGADTVQPRHLDPGQPRSGAACCIPVTKKSTANPASRAATASGFPPLQLAEIGAGAGDEKGGIWSHGRAPLSGPSPKTRDRRPRRLFVRAQGVGGGLETAGVSQAVVIAAAMQEAKLPCGREQLAVQPLDAVHRQAAPAPAQLLRAKDVISWPQRPGVPGDINHVIGMSGGGSRSAAVKRQVSPGKVA